MGLLSYFHWEERSTLNIAWFLSQVNVSSLLDSESRLRVTMRA